MSDNGDHITRREVNLIISAVDERHQALKRELTLRMVVTVVAANAFVTFASPTVAAVIAGLGIGSVAVAKLGKVAATLFLRS